MKPGVNDACQSCNLRKDDLPSPDRLNRIDMVRHQDKIKLLDEAISSTQTQEVTEDDKLSKCLVLVVNQMLVINEINSHKKVELYCKREIQGKITVLRKDVSYIE